MNRNTIVEIAIPKALYESIKGKILSEGKKSLKEAGKYDISDRDIPGLDKTQIKTLETWINLINADLNWWNTQYPNYSGNASIIMGDISKAFNLSIDDFVKKYENDNPISVANLVKKKLSNKLEEAKKKPSAGMTKKEKSAVVKKAAAGEDIGKKGKGFEKVAAKAAKEYGSKEAGKKVAAAAMWKAQAGKKK